MTVVSEIELSRTIGLIYDSALDAKAWPAALQAICGLVDVSSAAIGVHDPSNRVTRFEVEWTEGLPNWDYWRRLFDEKYMAMMPFYGSITQFEIGEVYNTAQMAEMVGIDDVYGHQFFREWATPAGLRDTVSSVIMKSPERFATFNLHTSVQRDLVGPRDLAIGALLVPHVRRSVVIGDLLGTAMAKAATLQATLDTLSAAVVVTDTNAKVLHCNAAAEQMLRGSDPISTENGALRTLQQPATAALLTAIGQTADPVNQIGSHGIGVPLSRADGGPSIAHVLPLAQGGPQRDYGPRGTAAVFIAPVEHAPPAMDAIVALFGLTPMEARVVRLIAEGRNRSDAAVALGIADSTAKTHLDRVYDKTSTRDQAGLAKLVASLASPARR